MSTEAAVIPKELALRPVVNPWLVAVTVTLATFMELLDTSIANVSLPYIAGGLGRSYDEVTWILTTYLVANAVVLPMSAWFSRALRRKRYYLWSVGLFTLTSLFCGIAPSLGLVLSARVLQGVGGGGLAPVAQAILVDTFPPAKRTSAFALYTVVIVTAPAIGPVLGGWMTDNYNWRWIFFINIPIGLLAFFLSARLLSDPPEFEAERKSAQKNGRLKIDGIGIILITLASGCLEITLDRGQIEDWFGSKLICWMLGIAVFGWIATIIWELRLPEPVVDFRLLANRNFAIASVLFFVFGLSLFGSTTLIPQLLQTLYGYRAIDAGLVLALGAFAITLIAPITAQLIQRGLVNPRSLILVSMTVIAVAIWHYSLFNLATDYTHYALARVFQGVGYGLFFVPASVIAYSTLKPDQNNKASSLTNLFRNWGGSFGIAMIAAVAERRANFHQSTIGAAIDSTSPQLQERVSSLTDYLVHQGYTQSDAVNGAYGYVYNQLGHQILFLGFMDCFRIIAWLTFATVPLVLLVKKFKPTGRAPASH